MARVYGEPAEVQAADDGQPLRFAWRGRSYAVRAVHEHWVVNRDWWREPAPVPAHPELRFWRVEATAGQNNGTYELCLDVAAARWTLGRVAD